MGKTRHRIRKENHCWPEAVSIQFSYAVENISRIQAVHRVHRYSLEALVKTPKTITLNDFLQTLNGFGKEVEKIRDFHLFIITSHDKHPSIWPLAFTTAQGGHFMWTFIFSLWENQQFK